MKNKFKELKLIIHNTHAYKEIFVSLTHTVDTFVILIRELLQHNVLK